MLDSLICELDDNFKQCMTNMQPFQLLQPPMTMPPQASVLQLVDMFPQKRPDCHALRAEMDIFIGAHQEKITAGTLDDIIQLAVRQRAIFPLVYQSYRHMLTAPASVATNERTFSRLKTVKNYCCSKTHDDRLEDLLLLTCEKDIADNLSLDCLADAWATVKDRRILLRRNE